MGVILVLTGLLAHPVEALAQAVALGQEQLALLGVLGHQVEGFLQLQARLAEVFVFDAALLKQLGKLFFQTLAAQAQLLGAGLAGREPGVEFALLAGFVLGAAAQLLAALFELLLLFALLLQPGFQQLQCGFMFLQLLAQALQLLAAGQYATLGIAGTADAQKVPANPVTVPADQALPVCQLSAQGQGLFEAVYRFDLAEPGRQIDAPFDLVEQATGNAHAFATAVEQAQFALIEGAQVQPVEIVDHYCLQIGAKHGFHRQLPTWLNAQAFGQARTLCQTLLTQPLRSAGAGVERRLLQGFERSQATAQALQLALGLLLGLNGLLQLITQGFELLDHLQLVCL
ncbi:hypothetical protein D3C81_1326820 [compost metagenome]